MTTEKFSQHVHVEEGGLNGYCIHCPDRTRHASLNRTVEKDGYATAFRRLNYIRNLNANHPAAHAIMSRDVKWLQREHGSSED